MSNSWSNSLCALLLVSIISCGDGQPKIEIPEGFHAEKLVSARHQLHQLLTAEMVAQIAKVPVEKLEQHSKKIERGPGQQLVMFSWKTGKTKNLGNNKHQIAEYHSLGIGFVSEMSRAAFEKHHGSNQGLQEAVNRMVEKENFTKELALLEAGYLAAYARRRHVEKLEQVGTLAFWERPLNALHVLVNTTAFTITSNSGEDEPLAKRNALSALKLILKN